MRRIISVLLPDTESGSLYDLVRAWPSWAMQEVDTKSLPRLSTVDPFFSFPLGPPSL
jgi:hypothetical protein